MAVSSWRLLLTSHSTGSSKSSETLAPTFSVLLLPSQLSPVPAPKQPPEPSSFPLATVALSLGLATLQVTCSSCHPLTAQEGHLDEVLLVLQHKVRVVREQEGEFPSQP